VKIFLDTCGDQSRRSGLAARTSLELATEASKARLAAGHSADPTEIPTWKRALDIACMLLLLPGALLLGLGITVVIKTVSRGPVFFKQERVGHRRKRFLCWKFRTMKDGADIAIHQRQFNGVRRLVGPMAKLDEGDDPRLIPGAAWLRAVGLDELPQLINVWRGEMSLVGPRPSLPDEVEGLRPWQNARFDTLPGMTGLWQVSGKNATTFMEMISLDIQYARSKTPWLDLMIMLRTFSLLVKAIQY
jgi:lipopolysaccharide/colanic/teichoic acid biosynthesis glycosyltransferase